MTYLILFLIITFFYVVLPHIDGGEFVLGKEVSEECCYEVNLTTDARYEIWVFECSVGPKKISVLIHKGPYVVFDDTFDLMLPEHDYLPYQPEFTVRENGTYTVHVKPLDEGVFRIGIRRYPRGIFERTDHASTAIPSPSLSPIRQPRPKPNHLYNL